MKSAIFLISLIFSSSFLSGQWDVYPQHMSFRTMNTGFDEWTHWTPFDISFWTNTNYNEGSILTPTQFSIYDMSTEVLMNETSLAFRDAFGDRIRMDYTGLNYINGASWTAFNTHVYGSAGQLDLYNGTGNYLARLGSTSMNSGNGSLSLYGGVGKKGVDIIANGTAGSMRLWGSNNTTNVYVGSNGPNHGWLYIGDDSGTVQVSIYANSITDQGVIEADVKNFRVPHPENDEMDILYACIEGPEAGAYERGSGQLVDGVAFIPYSEHYRLIANPHTATIQLTPQHWDTYGLAIVEKNEKGFVVRELKGGKGNFAFDWEVKSVRKGKEDYQVFRPKINLEERLKGNFVEEPLNDPHKKKHKKKAQMMEPVHQHTPECIHSKKR